MTASFSDIKQTIADRQTSVTLFSSESDLGFMASPIIQFLACDGWMICQTPNSKDGMDAVQASWKAIKPTQAWSKDSALHELFAWKDGKLLTESEFNTTLRCTYDVHKGEQVVAKRMSRALRVVKFYTFDHISVGLREEDWQLVDGRVLISRDLVKRVTENIPDDVAHYDRNVDPMDRDCLFEVTVQGTEGQIKGVAEVADLPESVDLMVGKNKAGGPDWKGEFKCQFGDDPALVMITLVPMHNDDTEPYLDLQTVINNLSPMGPLPVDLLLGWTRQTALGVLKNIESGAAMKKLGDVTALDVDDFAKMEQRKAQGMGPAWPLRLVALGNPYTEDVAPLTWPRLQHQLGDQWVLQLIQGSKFHVPNRSGALAIFTPRKDIKPGTCKYDHKYGWLIAESDVPWICATVGGGDLDDKLMGILFGNYKHELKVLLVRQPNGPGERFTLKFVGDYPDNWVVPQLKAFKNPKIEYGHMEFCDPTVIGYDARKNELRQMTTHTIGNSLIDCRRRSISLGMTANWLMAKVGTTGQAPKFMMLPISDVSDIVHGKHCLSRDSVEKYDEWLQVEFGNLAKLPIPKMLVNRFPPAFREELKINEDENHPINKLQAGVHEIIAKFNVALDHIAVHTPILNLGCLSHHYIAEAQAIQRMWGSFWGANALEERDMDEVDLSKFWEKVDEFKASFSEREWRFVMLSLAKVVYDRGPVEVDGVAKIKDGLLWAPRKLGIGFGDMFVEALQRFNVIHSVSWENGYGVMRNPKGLTPQSHRHSIAINGLTQCLGAAIMKAKMEEGQKPDEIDIPAAVAELVAQEHETFKATGETELFPGGIVGFQPWTLADNPRMGAFIQANTKSGLRRIGVTPSVSFEWVKPKNYHVKDFAWTGSQLIVIVED